jgi:hypothetical protein
MTRASDADEAQLAAFATALADGIEAALAGWVERSVHRRCAEASVLVDAELAATAADAGRRCRDQVAPAVRRLLATDLDAQTTTPLSLLRAAVRFPTEVLLAAGVPAPSRDEFDERAFPEDRYSLAPATFADIDPDLAEPALMWGAAKAHVHLARRRLEGRR